MKKTLLLCLVSLPLCAQERITFKPTALAASQALGNLKLRKDASGFSVIKDGKRTPVETHSVDPMLRQMSVQQLQKFQQKGRIAVRQCDNGDYVLAAAAVTKGGGILGANAGFWIANFAFRFVCHTGIAIAAACTGPAAPITWAALEGTLAAPIEAGAAAAGIAGGVVGGVATGPV